jgi:uncharacterized membrane protein YhaH (DUF805 family)
MNISYVNILLLLIVLTLDVAGIVQVWRDSRRSLGTKIGWTIAIVVLPFIGGIIWFLVWAVDRFARKSSRPAV